MKNRHSIIFLISLPVLVLGIPPHVLADSGQVLTLEKARTLALEFDPGISRRQHQAVAGRADALAAGQLPDPMLRLGAMNFPTDTFDRDQEPMTQLQVGLHQAFPAGDTLHYREAALLAGAREVDEQRSERARQVRLAVSMAWINRRKTELSLAILDGERTEFAQLQRVIESRVGTGRAAQSDLISVQLEQSRLQQQQIAGRQQVQTHIAALSRWVGTQAGAQPLPTGDGLELDFAPELPAVQDADLRNHPRYRIASRMRDISEARLQQAREAYGPSWGIDLVYGLRDGEDPNGASRPDFATAMVSVSLPIFPEKRQDASLAARHAELLAATDHQREILLQLRDEHAQAQARLSGLEERLHSYEKFILPQARRQAEAVLRSYRSDAGEFEALLRARLAVQSLRLEALQLQGERLTALAQLEYLLCELPATAPNTETPHHD